MGIDQLKLHSVQPGPSTITAQWSSGAKTQSATTSMIALDLSDATTQPADHNASPTRIINQSSGSIYHAEHSYSSLINSAAPLALPELTEDAYEPRFECSKEQKNDWSTITKMLEPATTSRSLNSLI
ncbi:DNA-directed RNA polymerase family protein [Dorcoceras hygrometricum]|uniref:DNA-directed RNA polymerase family protein n=1 Tax=Dorcoceras hygrometricum TaxID=472368 RepID=A0A2Z7CSQ4_9LAMI|nr:DNA-directed RNA polymerase family protein [Dorcoceras hygrometricum]